jgi:hypothetical protein
MPTVTLPTERITDWDSFHSVCQAAFGFPEFYGRNMNAWIDCLTYIDEGDGMSAFALGSDDSLFIAVPNAVAFRAQAPDILAALLECTAVVNKRSIDAGKRPRLALVLS